MNHIIKNYNQLASSNNRQIVLDIVEAGLSAIITETIVNSSIQLNNGVLRIKDEDFELDKYKSIKLIGFGKVSGRAASAISKILGDRINSAIIIDRKDPKLLEGTRSDSIIKYSGSHPEPSLENFKFSENLINSVKSPDKDDLIIVIVSGGGSALFCWPEQEFIDSKKLYDSFLATGQTINELNTVRKHISLVKGGGLAKLLYPAKVIGLIFSDVPGDRYNQVASGPTYRDDSTIKDAQNIIDENNLGTFNLIETPKENKYFENVENIILASNKIALEAMAQKAREFGIKVNIISDNIYDSADEVISNFIKASEPNSVILGGGEIRLKITGESGSGGRNSYLAMKSIVNIDNYTFCSIASDGSDNGDSAGAISDKSTLAKIEQLGLNLNDYIENFDSFELFDKLGDIIFTGPTGSNVSDLMLLLNKDE